MLSNMVRQQTRGFARMIGSQIATLGIKPNTLTIIGCLLNFIVAYFLARGQFQVAAFALIVIAPFDALDGATARANNQVTKFGAFLDSTLDRFSEAIILFGLLCFYLQQGLQLGIILLYLTLVGSLTTSYARARAEGAGLECQVGVFTRFERFVVLIVGLLLRQVTATLAVMAVLSNLTALHRIWYVYKFCNGVND